MNGYEHDIFNLKIFPVLKLLLLVLPNAITVKQRPQIQCVDFVL